MPILQLLDTILQEFPLALGRQRLRGNASTSIFICFSPVLHVLSYLVNHFSHMKGRFASQVIYSQGIWDQDFIDISLLQSPSLPQS
jgi:hypothetical protein